MQLSVHTVPRSLSSEQPTRLCRCRWSVLGGVHVVAWPAPGDTRGGVWRPPPSGRCIPRQTPASDTPLPRRRHRRGSPDKSNTAGAGSARLTPSCVCPLSFPRAAPGEVQAAGREVRLPPFCRPCQQDARAMLQTRLSGADRKRGACTWRLLCGAATA